MPVDGEKGLSALPDEALLGPMSTDTQNTGSDRDEGKTSPAKTTSHPRNTPKTCQAVEPTVKAILTGPEAVLDRIRMHRLMHTLIRMVPVSVIQEICQKISQRNVWRHRWGLVVIASKSSD